MNENKFFNVLKTHFVDTTAGYFVTNPIFALFENYVYGFSDKASLYARIAAGMLAYLGVGSLMTRGRDLSRHLFKIKDISSEKIQFLHDTVYSIIFTGVVSPFVYIVSGANDKEILKGTLTATGLSLINGYIVGYAVDLFRDLFDIHNSKRIPIYINNLSSKSKKSLAVILVVGSIAVNGTIYKLTPEKSNNVTIENIVNN